MEGIAVVGSRAWEPLTDVDRLIALIHADHPNWRIVSGGAVGVDQAAENAAIRLGMPVLSFRPYALSEIEYGIMECHFGPNPYMRKMVEQPTFEKFVDALFYRNMLIVDHSHRTVAFWDTVSKGTAFTIGYSEDQKHPTKRYTP